MVYPCRRLTYLGPEIDSQRRQVRLPYHKLREVRALLSQTLAKSKFTKRELQSLARKLNFAARAVFGGVHSCGDSLTHLTRERYLITGNEWHKACETTSCAGHGDLQWQNFLCLHWIHVNCRICHWCQSPRWRWPLPARLFYVNWQSDFPHLQSCHINELELFTVLLALRRWGPQLSQKWIVIYIDNTVTKSWLNKGTSGSKRTIVWLREIFWICAVHNFRVTSRYIPTTDNPTADTLSRLHNYLSTETFLSPLHSGSIANNCIHLSSTSLSLLPTQVQIALKSGP